LLSARNWFEKIRILESKLASIILEHKNRAV